MKNGAPTIYDVAERAGVSTGTVSKVMNNGDGVKSATARSVREAMAELGYQAPPPGSRRGYRCPKMSRRTGRIALVMSGMSRSVMRSPVYMDVQQGIEKGARENGQAIVLAHLADDQTLSPQLADLKVDGALVFGGIPDTLRSRHLCGLPLVRVMGIVDPFAGDDHVTYDNRLIGRLAADYMVKRGHQRCGFIGGLNGGMFGERGAVFMQCMDAAGGTVCAESDNALSITTEDVQRVDRVRMTMLLERLFTRKPSPTGLFIPADMLTNAAYPVLFEMGILPGRDIDVVSCNNEELLLCNLHPRPAVVDIHAQTVGQRGVEQLLWRIEHPADARVTVLIDPKMQNGDPGAE